MRRHAHTLKEVLVETIARQHPAIPGEVSDREFRACRQFLSHFLGPGQRGHVFTLNYDLLLYWTLMYDANSLDNNAVELRKNDGFGNDEDDPAADYVVWQGETAAHSANVLFLHGALHLFDAGAELQKYTWVRKGTPLVEQARAAIDDDKFPLFVAEGTSGQKKNKIRHNAYLYQCYKVLAANVREGRHCFFVFGHSLAENDDHILKRLGRGRFPKLYVGIYGDPHSNPTGESSVARTKSRRGGGHGTRWKLCSSIQRPQVYGGLNERRRGSPRPSVMRILFVIRSRARPLAPRAQRLLRSP